MSLAPQPADQVKGLSPSHLQLSDLKQRHMTVTAAIRCDTVWQVGYSTNEIPYGMSSDSYNISAYLPLGIQICLGIHHQRN
jgi:hypothetical protein